EYGREIDIWALGAVLSDPSEEIPEVITYVLLSGSLPFYHCVLHKLCAKLRESFVDGNPASPE
ncbi:unnamed protein product, partial [Effrenium voratum]